MSKKKDLEYTIGKYELQNTMSIAMSNILLKKEIFQKYDDIATQIILQTFFYISFPSKCSSLSHMHKFTIKYI